MHKKELLNSILIELDAITAFELVFKNKAQLVFEEFLEVISRPQYRTSDIHSAGMLTIRKAVSLFLPGRNTSSGTRIDKYILGTKGLRECKQCNSI